MYCIVVYDVNAKRVQKMLKLLRCYLHWIQNSVFEGELSEGLIGEMVGRAISIMDEREDSLIVFKMQSDYYVEKEIIGLDKSGKTSNIL